MKFTALFLICLVGFSLAGSPADAVLSQIDSLVQASRNEQSAQTRIFVGQHATCVSEIAFRSVEVRDAQVSQGWAQQQISINSAALPVIRAASRQTLAELKITRAASQANVHQNNEHVQITNQLAQTVGDLILSIQQAYNILGNFAAGKSALNSAVFFQVSQKINFVFKNAVKHNFHSQMIPVMNALVQLTSQSASSVSTSSILKVVQLLKVLEASIQKFGGVDAAMQAQQVAFFNKQSALLAESATVLKAVHAKLVAYGGRLTAQIASQTVVLRLASAKLARNSNILAATTSLCDNFDQKYKTQTGQRNQYVALLGSLRAFIVSSITDFKSGLYSRGDFVNQVQVQ